ncbi:MAG: hypothetical protein JSS76_02515 [Bacteroidetes bacterium]|nr:hypothetical protein [Bacteroidota bacterium]MBS1683598.1 hypothetical protein [Bacteroidota bacterium]
MIALHNLLDDLLIVLYDNSTIDLNVVFADRYYKHVSYAYLCQGVQHLIAEGYASEGVNSCLSITDKGREFIRNGGYGDKVTIGVRDMYDDHMEKHGSDSKFKLTSDDYLNMLNFPDQKEERKAANDRAKLGCLLIVLTLIIINLLRYGLSHS